MKNRNNRKNYSKSSKKKLNIRSNTIKKVNNVNDKKRKNFKFIKRSKDAEETQRKQKVIEDTYKQKVQRRSFESESEVEENEEVNHYDELLSSLAGSRNNKQSAIESDSDDEELDNEEIEDEEIGEEGNEEMSEGSLDEEDLEDIGSEGNISDEEVSHQVLIFIHWKHFIAESVVCIVYRLPVKVNHIRSCLAQLQT